jgi:murein DD-endopeptidase MepM/ murein hydrolase activator NlpD
MATLGTASIELTLDTAKFYQALGLLPSKLSSAGSAGEKILSQSFEQFPNKLSKILGIAGTNTKSQLSASGSAGGNAFAQSMAASAKASVAGVDKITATIATGTKNAMNKAGTSAGEAFSKNVESIVKAGASLVVSAVSSTGKLAASALGASGQQSGSNYLKELSGSLRGVKLPSLSGGKVTIETDISKSSDLLAQLPRQVAAAFAQVQPIAKSQSLQIGSSSGNFFKEKYIAGVQGVLELIGRPFAAIASVSKVAAESAATQSGTAFSTRLASTILQNTGLVEQSVKTVLQGSVLSANTFGQASGQTFLRSMGATVLQAPTGFEAAGSNAGQKFNQGAARALSSGSDGIVTGALKPFTSLGDKIGATMRSQLGNVGRGMGERLGQNITDGVMRGLAGIGSAIAGIENFSKFDAAARKANTLTDDIGALKKGAFELAKELKNTANATQILNAAEPVLSSGVTKTTDVLKVLKAAQIGAVGGFTDINTVADATTTIMSSFGLSADRASDIVQQMAGVQNAGKIQIGQYSGQVGKLSGTIALLGGSYDGLGLSLVEVNGLIANATAKGVRVSSAFDGMRMAMTSIAQPTKEAQDEAKKLGIAFDSTTLQAKGFKGILESLAKSKGASSELERIKTASEKAAKAAGGANTDSGKEAAAKAGAEAAKSATSMIKLLGSVEAVSAVAASAGKGGLADLAKAMEVIRKTDANAAFDKVSGGVAKQSEALTNKLIDFDNKIKSGAFGEILLAGMKLAGQGIDYLISQIEKLNTWFLGLTPQAQNIVKVVGGVGLAAVGAAVGITGIAAAGALIAPAFIAGVGAIASLAVALGTAVVAVAPLAIPLLAAAAAVYGLSKAFGATDGEAFRNSLIAIGAGLAIVFGPAAIGAIAAGVTALVTGFGAIAIAAAAALIPLLPWIAAAAAVALALYGLYKAFEFAKPTLQAWGAAIKSGIETATTATIKFAQDTGTAIGSAIKWFVNLQVESAKWLAAVAGAVGKWAGDMVAAIGRWATPFTSLVSGAWNKFASSTASALSAAWNATIGFINRCITGFSQWVAGISASVGSFVRQNFLIQATVRGAGDTIKFFGDISTRTFKLIVDGGNFLAREIKAQFDGIVESVSRVINWFKDLPGAIKRSTDAITNFNNTRPTPPPQQRSAAPRQTTPIINEQVAFSNLGDGVVSDSPQSLFAKNPTRRPPAIPASAQGVVNQTPQQIPPPAPPTSAEVMSSVYYPGGGQTAYEGGEIDARNRRLTNQDKAIAIPGLNRPDGIPYGSRVRVTNPANGLSTEADVRDAGPFKPGRQMDITGAVAKEIKFSGLGILQVEIVKLAPGADPNKVYQFGEATKFRETKASTIAPGSSIALGQPQPQVPTPTQRPPRVASPFADQTIEQIANQPLNPVEQFRADRIRKGRVVKNDHRGVDYPAEAGTPVFASYSGTAKFEDWGKTYGLALVTTFRDAMGREAVNVRGHIDPTTALAQTGQKVGESFNVQAGQPIGTVKDLGRDFFRRNPGIRNHVHDEAYLGTRNTPPVDARDFMLAQKQAEQTALGTEPRQPDANLTAAQVEEAKLIRALENAQRDRNVASMGLEDLRRNRPIANQRVTGKGKRRRLTGKSQSELDSAYNTKLAAAEEKLRDADDKLLSAQEAISKSRAEQAEAAKKAEIAEVQARASDINSTTSLKIAGISRRVAEGTQALAMGKPMPANALSEENGIKQKNALLAEQRRQLDELKPRINELAAKYNDPESLQSLKQIAENVQQIGAAAADSAAEIARTPIGDLEQGVASKISALQLQNLGTDFGVAKNPTDANRQAGEETKSTALTKMAEELQLLLPQAEKLMATYKDPESQRRLEEIVKIIQQQGIEALNTAKNIQTGKVEALKNEASAIQTKGGREEQSLQNQFSLGFIKSELELNQKLNQSKLATAALLDQLIPRFEQLRSLQTDPAIIEAINEQIAGIRKLSAETTTADRALIQSQRESSFGFQLTKGSVEATNESLKSMFANAIKGSLDLGSALDGLLNKIADLAISMAFDKFITPMIGGALGFKAGGTVPNFADGGAVGTVGAAVAKGVRGFADGGTAGQGKIPNYASGGAVSAMGAISAALKKEGANSVLAALTPGEQVLNLHDAAIWRNMAADGTWAKLSRVYNYSGGGVAGGGVATRSAPTIASRSQQSGTTDINVKTDVTRINGMDFVTLEQYQQGLTLAAKAGAAIVDRNMQSTSWRQQNGL